MTLWQGVVLGLVQGLTEFLPVSSSGHLVLVEALSGVHFTDVTVEVSLHVATLGSVLVLYGARLWTIARGALRGDAASARYVVEKGSITVDGVSLTVSALSPPGTGDDEQWFEVCLIPETLKRTTLGTRAPGDTVNLEVDVIAKYVERLMDREDGK